MSHIERTTVHWAKDHIVDEYSTNDKSASSNALDDDQESSEESQICMTIICNGGSVACSYFDPQTGILYIMEDTEENNHFDLTLRVLEHIGPNLVLTSTKSDELFMDFVRDQMERLDGALQIRPWKEFTVSHGLTRLYSLPLLAGALPDEDGDYLQEEAQDEPRNAYEFMAQRGKSTAHPTLTRWCAGVRLGNFTIDSTKAPLCFSAIGALLDYLMRARAVDGFTCDIEELEQVTKIEYVALNDVMQINNDALVSLQVFLSEKHASIYSNAFKEGLSIYGILNHTRTPLGSALLRQWLLRPSRSLTVIRHRHEAVSFFLKADNLAQSDILHKHIGGLKGAPIALKRLRNGRATLQNWKAMVQFWVSAALIKTDLLELFPNSCILASEELLNDIQSSTFVEVAEDINATIDWDESANLGRVTVKPLVDQELDTWKETLAGLDSLLSRVAEKVAEDVPPEEADLYGELSVIYFPQLGYLISIPVRQDCPIEEQRVGLQGWAFQFMTDESVYFKSNKMHEMDYHVGDLNTYIMDREIEILQSLQINVLGHSDFIMAICENAAILDCLLSYAAAARQYEWVRPVMCEESIIDIRGGRHPLQELIDEHFVSNDTYTFTGSRTRSREYSDTSDIDDTETVESSNTLEARQGHSITICTGANASGKSVYLKQCALIPYMAQVGCFVPAISARLGVIERVFTRIQTRESVSKMQSALMIDLNQVSLALRNASTSRSIIILDEFGKGTISSDGAGLFAGVIKYLLSLGDACPFVFAATHFHEVLTPSILPPSSPISFIHMSVMITTREGEMLEDNREEAQEDRQRIRPGEAVTYLFKVSEGLCLHSHASKCALTWGIPQKVVTRAEYVSELLNRNELNALLDEQMSELEREELLASEVVCRRFLDWDLASLVNKGNVGQVREMLAQVVEGPEVVE